MSIIRKRLCAHLRGVIFGVFVKLFGSNCQTEAVSVLPSCLFEAMMSGARFAGGTDGSNAGGASSFAQRAEKSDIATLADYIFNH